MIKTQNEIIQQGYRALINSLGVIDTIRFLQFFSPSKGDYTKERHQWLDNKSLEDVFREMEELPADDSTQYEKIID